MTKTQGRLIKGLAALNILIFAGAAWLLWYVWPVLVESPAPVVPTSSFVVPVAAPSLTAETASLEPEEVAPLTPPKHGPLGTAGSNPSCVEDACRVRICNSHPPGPHLALQTA